MYKKLLSIFGGRQERRTHLDYAATTPVHPEVRARMEPYWSEVWANPSAIYREGVEARNAINAARLELARMLHVREGDITFTSGGTESNNLALIGLVEALHRDGRAYSDMEILTTALEHPSILETLTYLKHRGISVRFVPTDAEGLIDTEALKELLHQKTILVTCAYVNSEIGVVQDIKKITRIVRAWNESEKMHVYTHTDASQAPLWLPCMLDMLGVDMLTLDAGKCYGPKGVGVLAHRHWVPLSSVNHGGGQEGGLRSGTENVALIVGCTQALIRAQEGHEARSVSVARLRDEFLELLTKKIPRVIVNGSLTHRVANNINLSLPQVDTEYAVIWLDARGVAASTKSACGAPGSTGSEVVRALTGDDSRARSTIRFTLGEETTHRDVVRATELLKTYCTLMESVTTQRD